MALSGKTGAAALTIRQKAAFDGTEIPDEHPLLTAARNSPDPRWQASMYGEDLPERGEDMSETA